MWNTLKAFPAAGGQDQPLKTPRGYAIGIADSMVIVMSDKATAGVRSMVNFVLPSCKVICIEAPIEVSMFCPGPVLYTGPFLCGQN